MTKSGKSSLLTFGIGLALLVSLYAINIVAQPLLAAYRLHPLIGIAAAVVFGLGFWLLLVRPVVELLRLPPSPFAGADPERLRHCSPAELSAVARALEKSPQLSQAQRDHLTAMRMLGDNMADVVQELLNQQLQELETRLVKRATAIAAITAIVPSSALDFFAVVFGSVAAVQDSCQSLGMRPNKLQLCRLSIGIMIGAYLVDSLDELPLGDIIALPLATLVPGTTVIPGLGTVAGALLQGAGSALTVLRVGYCTRNYLLGAADADRATRRQQRRQAWKDAVTSMPKVIGAARDAVADRVGAVGTAPVSG